MLVLFLGLSIYYFFEARAAKNLLIEKTLYLENALEETKKNCEAKVDRLKFRYENKSSDRIGTSQEDTLSGVIEIIKQRREQSRKKILDQVIFSLELDEDGIKGFKDSIEHFENQKRTLMNQAKDRNGSIFNPEYIEKFNDYRKQTLILLSEALPEDKFNAFLEYGFDEKLDLRKR
jgi:hypothetical protein